MAPRLAGVPPGPCHSPANPHLPRLPAPILNQTVAAGLGVAEGAARKRYLRALVKLKGILAEQPGGLEKFKP